jgi:WhiB family redox-sensing transcriptional regulator
MAATLSADAFDHPDTIGPRPDWVRWAECAGVDPDLFFPERGATTRQAKAVCAGCPVREGCLEFALASVEKFGIWGGKSERERRILRRRKAAGK